jgi:hypothetical protein
MYQVKSKNKVLKEFYTEEEAFNFVKKSKAKCTVEHFEQVFESVNQSFKLDCLLQIQYGLDSLLKWLKDSYMGRVISYSSPLYGIRSGQLRVSDVRLCFTENSAQPSHQDIDVEFSCEERPSVYITVGDLGQIEFHN